MSDRNKEILNEAVFSLEAEGFTVTDLGKQMVSEMLEGERVLQGIIREFTAKGKMYAGV
jgi:hypothetical protein